MDKPTWPKNSIRPYESLWMLTQRFMWLNVISSRALGNEVGIRDWWRLNLITSDCNDVDGEIERARKRLIKLLELTRLETAHAMVKGSLVVETDHVRFCPKCLRLGYHSSVHQLRCLSSCPLHQCELSSSCATCKKPIPLSIAGHLTSSPLTCPWCRTPFIEFRVLVNPPVGGNFSAIGKLWKVISELPRVEWMSGEDGDVAFATLISRILVDRLQQGRNGILHFHFRYSNPERIDPEDCYLLTAREQRSVALYKSYRRHLESMISGARNFANGLLRRLEANLPDSVWFLGDATVSPEACAFGLFRYAIESRGFEGLRTVHARRATWWNPATRRKCLPDINLLPRLRWPKEFHCSEIDHQWIEDHVLMASLQSIFHDCLKRGRKIKKNGKIDLRILHNEVPESNAAAISIFDANGELQFWSHQFPRDRRKSSEMSDYDIEVEDRFMAEKRG